MKPRTIGYLFKESLISLKRNGWMSIASVLTVAVSLFIFGLFSLLLLNVNYMASSVESSVEIKAFLKDNTMPEDIERIKKEITALPGVQKVIFVSRDQAFESLKKQFGEEHDLLAALDGDNPLPDSFTIKTKTTGDVAPTAQTIENLTEVEKVRYGQGVIEKLFAVIKWVRLLGMGIMALLALAAVVLIAITIRLTVYARRKEITIMKYVGATNWFIRWPFLLEGMLLGLIGSLVAVGCLFWIYASLLENVGMNLAFVRLLNEPILLRNLNFTLIAAGTILGGIGSVVSIRKFLKV